VGTGVIAWAHAIGVQALIRAGVVDASVVAVHDLDDARAVGFAAVNGAAVVSSGAEVLERCDVVWVCTPTAAHRDVVEAASRRGIAVFCEKPLAPDLAGAEALAATVAGSGVPAQVGLVLRRAPVFRALRDVLVSGELGVPMTAIFRDDQYFPVQGLYSSTWRGDVEVARPEQTGTGFTQMKMANSPPVSLDRLERRPLLDVEVEGIEHIPHRR